MKRGFLRGMRKHLRLGIDMFIDDEGGYTTVAVACALLGSLALVFALAQGIWTTSRNADIQAVADASALSAEQTTKAFTTCAQVVDATVLSLGLTGVFVLGAGVITSLVPGFGGVGLKMVDAGKNILDSRDTFAQTSAKGLASFEKTLPYAEAANAYSTAASNSAGAAQYSAIALPFPAESHSDFGEGGELDATSIEEAAKKNAELSDKAAKEKKEADQALEDGWRADNVDNPMCAYSRARDLAHVSDAVNPHYSSPEEWSFGAALVRARTYYAARAKEEIPYSSSVAERANSAMRAVFYDFSLQKMNEGSYVDTPDQFEVNLPELPRNTQTTKETRLYTDALWPCTYENGERVLHAYRTCPGASGADAGWASLQDLDRGVVKECSTCKMNVSAMGKVAQASTSINNGFEYYWKKIVEASKRFEKATKKYRETLQELEGEAKEDAGLFESILKKLAVPRPKLCPPGAYGCIAVVMRAPSDATNSKLTNGFSTHVPMPSGVAIAGATLAPDDATADNNVLSRFFDFMAHGEDGSIPGVLAGITTLWGNVLTSYNQSAERLSDVSKDLFNTLSGVGLGTPAAWLSNRLGDIVSAAGFAPSDIRLRKAVLCNTESILSQDGSMNYTDLKQKLEALPTAASPQELVSFFGRTITDDLGQSTVTLAELTLPGTNISIPITLDLSKFWSVT